MACWLLGDMSHHEFHAALYSKNPHFQASILTKIDVHIDLPLETATRIEGRNKKTTLHIGLKDPKNSTYLRHLPHGIKGLP